MLSPTKKRAARPRVLSDYGMGGEDANGAQDEDEGEDLDQPSPTATQSGRISCAGNASIIELGGPPSGSGARKPNAGRASPARPLDGEFVSVVAPCPNEFSRHAPHPPEPKVKTEKGLPAASSLKRPASPVEGLQGSQSQPPSNKGQKGDESFLVAIEYSEDPESRSLFKTRGRHMVSKVLMQACRTFGLEEYYHRYAGLCTSGVTCAESVVRSAQLVLLIEEEDESGEIVFQRRYACSRDETMSEAGAEPNARFLVEIDYDDDE